MPELQDGSFHNRFAVLPEQPMLQNRYIFLNHITAVQHHDQILNHQDDVKATAFSNIREMDNKPCCCFWPQYHQDNQDPEPQVSQPGIYPGKNTTPALEIPLLRLHWLLCRDLMEYGIIIQPRWCVNSGIGTPNY